MQKSQNLHDIYIEGRSLQHDINAALATAFHIPPTNIFFEDSDTSAWNNEPYHAFVYPLADSDISWRLDVQAPEDVPIKDSSNPSL